MSEGERARLHALLEQIPAAIAIVRGPEFVYELSNAMNRQFTQGRAVVGRRLSEALPELSDFIKLIEHVYRTGESFRGTEVPARLMQSDGVVRDVYLTGAYEPLRNAAGEIDGVLGFAYEVTESVVARKRAEESEAKLRRLYDSGVIGVVYWTREGQLVDANDAFLQMVGYTREELKSGLVRWRDMTPPEFAAADERAFAEMEQRGICTPYEKEYLHKSGERIPIQLGVALWEGSTTEGVAWILDMRAQRRAEAALRLREAQLRAITDTIPALIALIGSDERYLLINRVHEQWFRTASEQVVGRTVRELLGEEGYARVRSRIERVLAGDTVTFEERIAYPDVGLRDVRATYVPHRNAAGAVDGFVVLVLDVTAEKQAERDRVDLFFREQ